MTSKKRAALGELATGVAHEMNSPLSAVYNNLQYLSALLKKEHNELNCKKSKDLTAKSQRIVAEIFEITNKLKSFGESYGDISLESVDLDAVVKSIIHSFENTNSSKKIYFTENKGLLIKTYRSHLYNALSSIACISVQLNETTFISINQVNEFVEFEFTGANKEVPSWIRNYLSIPFFEHDGEIKGSGLELSMAKDAIESMMGQIIVAEESDDFIFKIQIPFNIDENKKVA